MSKILIVDDNLANREILRLRLERMGHEVVEAADGEEGVRCARAESPSLIFLDVMMPKKDGWQACRELKQEEKTRAIPVVMLTALQQTIEEMRRNGSGADDFLPKPWTPENLKEVVERWLPA
jgi:CheY-like chemotaxis protein